MATKKVFWLVSTKAKGLKFRVTQLDRDTMMATLQGDTGVPFQTSINQETLDQFGYRIDITQEEVGDDAAVHSQPQTA